MLLLEAVHFVTSAWRGWGLFGFAPDAAGVRFLSPVHGALGVHQRDRVDFIPARHFRGIEFQLQPADSGRG